MIQKTSSFLSELANEIQKDRKTSQGKLLMFPSVNWVSSSPVTELTALLINHVGKQALQKEWKGNAILSECPS